MQALSFAVQLADTFYQSGQVCSHSPNDTEPLTPPIDGRCLLLIVNSLLHPTLQYTGLTGTTSGLMVPVLRLDFLHRYSLPKPLHLQRQHKPTSTTACLALS